MPCVFLTEESNKGLHTVGEVDNRLVRLHITYLSVTCQKISFGVQIPVEGDPTKWRMW